MTTLRGVLSAVAAVLVALFAPALVSGLGNSKATGLAAVAAGLFSPLVWILAIPLFALFFAASRLKSTSLRILLFWIPVTAISMLGVGVFSLVTSMWIHFR